MWEGDEGRRPQKQMVPSTVLGAGNTRQGRDVGPAFKFSCSSVQGGVQETVRAGYCVMEWVSEERPWGKSRDQERDPSLSLSLPGLPVGSDPWQENEDAGVDASRCAAAAWAEEEADTLRALHAKHRTFCGSCWSSGGWRG